MMSDGSRSVFNRAVRVDELIGEQHGKLGVHGPGRRFLESAEGAWRGEVFFAPADGLDQRVSRKRLAPSLGMAALWRLQAVLPGQPNTS